MQTVEDKYVLGDDGILSTNCERECIRNRDQQFDDVAIDFAAESTMCISGGFAGAAVAGWTGIGAVIAFVGTYGCLGLSATKLWFKKSRIDRRSAQCIESCSEMCDNDEIRWECQPVLERAFYDDQVDSQ